VNRAFKLLVPLAAALAMASCNGSSSGVPTGTGGVSGANDPAFVGALPVSAKERALWGANVQPACPAVPGKAQCMALIRTDTLHRSSSPVGLTAQDLEQAYDLPSSSKGSGQIVALVDAYDNPDAASDLATYRSTFGLPAANFTKYNQNGQQGDYPQGSPGWGVEIDLDIEMVSAACPNCTIYLIEANSSNPSDMDTAVAEAVTLGAHIVSNSYRYFSPCGCESYFETPGVTFLASAGDSGYSTEDPMDFPTVVAVGGTSLTKDTKVKRGWDETVWNGTGSGCATSYTKPSWQHDPDCTGNMRNDVAADANPATGPAEYDTYSESGWFQIGGTSVSSPFNGGVFGLAGTATQQDGGETFWIRAHQHKRELYHITSGSNGSCAPNYYFCEDGTHMYRDYGGPTGWGVPHNLGAYRAP
jgi:subtilase family serine protease